jgi:Domain of unknown function (DUF4279)
MSKSTVSLRVFGEDLEPDALSTLFGCFPDKSYRKGDTVSPRLPEHRRKCGMWSIKAVEAEPEAYDSQIQQVLSRVSQDESVWKSVRESYEVALFCGFFMDTTNQGFCLSVASLEALARRGIQPSFDIYAPTPEEEAEYYAKRSDA